MHHPLPNEGAPVPLEPLAQPQLLERLHRDLQGRFKPGAQHCPILQRTLLQLPDRQSSRAPVQHVPSHSIQLFQ